MEEKEVTSPSEVKDDRESMNLRLEQIRETYKDKISPQVFQGLQTAVQEYYDNKESYAKRKLQQGNNPLEYFDYKTNKGEGLIDTKKYYDISKAESSNIGINDLYKMFAPQVIDQLKKGKVISLPETYDIGAHYSSVGSALNIALEGQARDIPGEKLQDVRNTRYRESMQERLDYLVNNTKADDLYTMFSPDEAKKYNKEYDNDNLGFIIKNIVRKSGLAGDKELSNTYETNTADAFNRLLSSATGGGRNLKSGVFFDSDGNQVDVEAYKPRTGNVGSEYYQKGYQKAIERNPDKPMVDYIAEQYAGIKGKGNNFEDYQQGFLDRLQEDGMKVVNKKGTKDYSVMGKVKINLNYKDGVLGRSVNIGEGGKEIDYMDLPNNMRNYVDRVSFLEKLTGDQNTAITQGGEGYAPI